MSEEEEYESIEKRQKTDDDLLNSPGDLLNSPGDLLDGFDDFLKSPEEEEEAAFGFVDTAAGTTSSSSLLDEIVAPVSTESLDIELSAIEARHGITTSVQESAQDLIVECLFSNLKFIFSLASRSEYETGKPLDNHNDDEFDFLASFSGDDGSGRGGIVRVDVVGYGGESDVVGVCRERLGVMGVCDMRIGDVLDRVCEGLSGL
jgi:hypothetical protein